MKGSGIVKEVNVKIFDYCGVIEEQVEHLQDIQRKRSLPALEACEIAKTIDNLLDSRLKYDTLKK